MTKAVYYSGTVQGVGFRATAAAIARRYPIRGWVQNLVSGSVELVVDGERDAVEAFLANLRSRMAEYIANEEHHDREMGESPEDFQIRY
jgi:acylphosphatase